MLVLEGIAGRIPLLKLKQNLVGMLPSFGCTFHRKRQHCGKVVVVSTTTDAAAVAAAAVRKCNRKFAVNTVAIEMTCNATGNTTTATAAIAAAATTFFPCASCQVCCLNYCNMSIFPLPLPLPLPLLLSCQRQFLALNYVHGTHRKPQSRTIPTTPKG